MKKNPNQVFDEVLVTQMMKGDQKAMQLFIKRWQSPIYHRICYLTNDSEIAKDLAQEAWAGILRNIHTLKNVGGFKSWIMTVASRKAYDWIRKQNRVDIVSIETVEAQLEEDDEEELKESVISSIRESIRDLESGDRIILSMFYLENMNINQISTQLGIPKGTVKSRLFYAREHLKAKIKEVHHET